VASPLQVSLDARRILGVETINYDSPVQLRKVLFDILKLKPVAQTRKTRQPSTAEASLTVLSRLHELPRLVLQKRAYERLSSYYGEGFEARIGPNGRVRTHYLIHGTETGRLSSRNPNLQNIPRLGHDAEMGPASVVSRVRDIFVAEPGSLLIDADYAQIEFRLLANYTQDPQMLSDILHHVDIHQENAALVFGKAPSAVTEQERQMAKGLTYALIYGAGAFRIASLFGISLEAAQGIIDRLYHKYPGARRYHERMIHAARAQGYVTNLYGRRRRLPGILSTDPKLRGHYERSAINSPIQGLAAELLYIAMIRLREAFKRECPGARLVLTVHDSITTEVPHSQVPSAIRVIQREMLRPMPGITVPLEVELKTGTSLGNIEPFLHGELPGIL
jgi:DNA polymerase-1